MALGGGPFGLGLGSPLGASPEALFGPGGSAVAIPEGDPDALREAEGKWVGMAEVLARQAGVLDGGAGTVSLADWHGSASLAFSASASLTGSGLRDAAEVCRDVAAGCARLAGVLEDAQGEAKKAARAAEEASERGRSATRRLRDAERRAEAARVAVDDAARREAGARAGGILGEPMAQEAFAEGVVARGFEADARYEVRRFEGEVDSAGEDLRAALSRGGEANEAAEQAAERAAGVFERAAAGLRAAPASYLAPAVPVTVLEAKGPLGLPALMPWWSPPGSTPGDARDLQIRIEQQRRLDLAEKRKGGYWDAVAGEIKGYGGFHPGFGDPDTDRYKGGENLGGFASWVPGPGMLRRILQEGGEQGRKRVVKEGGEEGAEALAKRYRDRAKRDTKELTEALKQRLKLTDKPEGSDTHHLIPKGAYSNRSAEARKDLEQAQAQMQRLEIGPEDARNGAFVPRGNHNRIHTDEYFRVLNERLKKARNEKEGEEILDKIREEVTNGTFPH